MLLGATAAEFCADTAGIWGLLGWVVFILKIVIPLILIVLGMIDLGKAVVESDDKAINTAVNTLLHRFIAAVVVFFIPTIVLALFHAIMDFDVKNSAKQCVDCLLNRSGQSNCTSDVAGGM